MKKNISYILILTAFAFSSNNVIAQYAGNKINIHVLINGVCSSELYIDKNKFPQISMLATNLDSIEIKSFQLYCYKFRGIYQNEDSLAYDRSAIANNDSLTSDMNDMIYSNGKEWLVDFDWCKFYDFIFKTQSGNIIQDSNQEVKIIFLKN